ncbi:hypothetical protein IWZ01DRAFT_506370 [Phyllosticta capitalensis]
MTARRLFLFHLARGVCLRCLSGQDSFSDVVLYLFDGRMRRDEVKYFDPRPRSMKSAPSRRPCFHYLCCASWAQPPSHLPTVHSSNPPSSSCPPTWLRCLRHQQHIATNASLSWLCLGMLS